MLFMQETTETYITKLRQETQHKNGVRDSVAIPERATHPAVHHGESERMPGPPLWCVEMRVIKNSNTSILWNNLILKI
jgi:hypothetical protein